MRFSTRLLAVLSLGGMLATLSACGGSSTTPPPPPATYTISGTITGAASVSVALSGAATTTATTDGSGNYTFTGLANGSYTVTPSKAGYTFTPATRSVTVASANQTAQNFTAALITYTVSGTITGASSVLVNLGQGASVVGTSTDGSGNFSFTVTNGTYTLEPVLSGYTFAPLSRVVVVNGANVPGNTFTATAVTTPVWSINVQLSGAVLQGVTLTLTQLGTTLGTAASSDSGFHAFAGLADGTYLVTPTLAGYTFNPASRSVTVTGADPATLGFAATAITYTISGTISGASSVSVSLTGAATQSMVTAPDGTYSFPGLASGSYTVTPSKTGYAFSPLNRAVTVSVANPAAQDFTASLAAIYSISGTVSGTVLSGVTMTLSGTASATQTTDASGNYAFTGLTLGSYTVTPSKSGSAFAPASLSPVITSASLTAQNFTSSPGATYTLSGTVTGAWGENVLVTLGGAAAATTRTAANGTYSFQGLNPGSYTVQATLAGYLFTPSSAQTVVIGAANTTQDFVSASAVVSYSISGTVAHTGGTGPIYVGVTQGCTDCSPSAGVSIAGPGPFTVRGLVGGGRTYQVVAWRDVAVPAQGTRTVASPVAVSAMLNITTADLTGVSLTLATPTQPSPQTPGGFAVYPANGGATAVWNRQEAGSVVQATGYRIRWGTDNAASNRTPIDVAPTQTSVYMQGGLVDGTSYYYKLSSMVGAAESTPTAVFGPVISGAVTGLNTLSGTVTFTGTATGPLLVGAFDMSSGIMRGTRIASPVSPQAFTVTGIPTGTNFFHFAVLDQNDNGTIDTGDLGNTNSAGTIAITANTTHDLVLSGANADVRILTTHQTFQGGAGSDNYGIQVRAEGQAKLPVALTLYSGPDVAVPFDIGKGNSAFQGTAKWSSTVPAIGDSYLFKVWYSDGTSELKTASVTVLLNSFAQNLFTDTTASATIPTFRWEVPVSPPLPYTFRLGLQASGGSQYWYYPQRSDMPSSQLSVRYNIDGSASVPSLSVGTTYNWYVTVTDREGNEASVVTSYRP
jgi:hypothetical protein